MLSGRTSHIPSGLKPKVFLVSSGTDRSVLFQSHANTQP